MGNEVITRAMTIAGSDSGGGAGIQADLKTFAALGVYGTSALTSITAQNTVGVQGVHDLPPEFVALQIDSIASDIGADAVKTGMLSNAGIIEAVADRLSAHGMTKVVVDPVMVAKSGDPLLAEDAREALIRLLLPMAMVVTPNLHEAAALSGGQVDDPLGMREAARAIFDMGPGHVVIKGGHLDASPMDLLYDGVDFVELTGPRHDTPHTHGTGCTFASAVAALLARGRDVPAAVAGAKEFVSGAIQAGFPLGRGYGPTHHMAGLYEAAGISLLKQ